MRSGSRGKSRAQRRRRQRKWPQGRSGPREPVSCQSGRAVSNAAPGGGRAGGSERAEGLENSRRAEGLYVEQGQSRDLARSRGTRGRPGGPGRRRVSEFRVSEAG